MAQSPTSTTSLKLLLQDLNKAILDSERLIKEIVTLMATLDSHTRNVKEAFEDIANLRSTSQEELNKAANALKAEANAATAALNTFYKKSKEYRESAEGKQERAEIVSMLVESKMRSFNAEHATESLKGLRAANEEINRLKNELNDLEDRVEYTEKGEKALRVGKHLSPSYYEKEKLRLNAQLAGMLLTLANTGGSDSTAGGLGQLLAKFIGSNNDNNNDSGVTDELLDVGLDLVGKLGPWGKAIETAGHVLKTISSVISTISKTLETFKAEVKQSIDTAVDTITDPRVSKLDSRLYGLLDEQGNNNVNFIELATDAVELVGSSPLIRSLDLLNNIIELGNDGIAYNLELRALWATLSDKLVSTFEVTNDYLLRMILLLQSELTDTYMGIEAAITRTLNSMYTDSQYLENGYDAVYRAMTEALSNVDTDLGTLIAYLMQLWLGSLSSLGMSTSSVESIAQTFNNLLTGDIANLSDLGLKLVAMAASNADISYADILVEGVLDGKTLNKLMASMVEILQDIYDSAEDNNVVLSQWGDVFGFEISDWKAISNLTENYINQLTSASMQNFDLESAIDETAYISNNLVSARTTVAERVKNLVDNTMYGMGFDIATSESDYLTWYLSDLASSLSEKYLGTSATSFINKVTDILLDITLLTNVGDNLLGLVGTIKDGILDNNMSYSLFMQDKTMGSLYAALMFEYLLGEGNYIDYTNSNLLNSSYNETVDKGGWIQKIFNFFSSNDSEGEISATDLEVSETDTSGFTGGGGGTSFDTGESASGTTTTSSSKSYNFSSSTKTLSQMDSSSALGYSNTEDKRSNITYDITDLYTVLTGTEGAHVKIVGVDPSVTFTSTANGTLVLDSGSLDAHIRSVVALVVD